MALFSALDLVAPLMRTLKTEGFVEPTPIQEQSIPALLQGNDLVGVAQTGSGKTAAFVLPMLQKLHLENKKPESGMPRAVILAPTRELAKQIGDVVRTFSKSFRLSHTIIFGGTPFQPQTKALKRGVDILIATPGRLLDHMRRKNVYFDLTNTFILDEADRMLDMGFIDDVQTVAKALPEEHQTVFFSATMGKKVRALADQLLTDPVSVEVAQESTVAETIDHKVMYVTRKNKFPLVLDLLKRDEVKRVLIFTRTRRDADELCDDLDAKGFHAEAIHGEKKQRVRERTLQAFRNGRFDILVATDVAARGIDVPDITHVINYDIPIEADNYVHRIGRTGRAGEKGTAISLCEGSNIRLLKEIEKIIRMPIDVDKDHDYHVEMTYSETKGGNRGRGRGRGFGGGGDRKRGGDRSRTDRRQGGKGRRDKEDARSARPHRGKAKPAHKKDGDDRSDQKKFSERKPYGDRKFKDHDDRPRKSFKDRDDRPRKSFSDRSEQEKPRERKSKKERVQYGQRNHRFDGSPRENRIEPAENTNPFGKQNRKSKAGKKGPDKQDRFKGKNKSDHMDKGKRERKPEFDSSVDRSNPFDKIHRDGRPGRKGKANTKFAGNTKKAKRKATGGDQPLTRYKSKTRSTLRAKKRSAKK